jgi:site-specific DNA recombinase
MNKQKKIAIAYYRVSTDIQKEEKTIETQKFKVEEFAKKNNYEIIESYSDDGVSGGLENRPSLSRMLSNIKNTEAEYILIYKLDRLARDLNIQEGLIIKFNNANKKLISTLEPDLDGKDPFRKAFRQMLGVFSEFEKSMITLRLEGGRERKAKEGGWHGGKIYGYKNNKGKLIIDISEANIIKKMFKLRRQRLPYKKIANELNKLKIPTARSESIWRGTTIRRMIKNPIYKNGNIKYKGNIYKTKIIPILKNK